MHNEVCGFAGGRLSLHWDRVDAEITFIREDGGWFWVTYDRKLRQTLGAGKAATVDAAVEQALDLVSGSALLAAE